MSEGVPVSATDNTRAQIAELTAGYSYTELVDKLTELVAAERAKAWDESMTTADIWYQERLAGIPPTGRYPANPYREVQ